jgi:hypothetical protein
MLQHSVHRGVKSRDLQRFYGVDPPHINDARRLFGTAPQAFMRLLLCIGQYHRKPLQDMTSELDVVGHGRLNKERTVGSNRLPELA